METKLEQCFSDLTVGRALDKIWWVWVGPALLHVCQFPGGADAAGSQVMESGMSLVA